MSWHIQWDFFLRHSSMKYGRNLLGKNEFRRKDNGMTKKKKKGNVKDSQKYNSRIKTCIEGNKKKKKKRNFY